MDISIFFKNEKKIKTKKKLKRIINIMKFLKHL